MKLSFCIPTYNRINYLKQTLPKILKSENKNFEVIICDNNSTDETNEFCEDIASKDDRVKYFRNLLNLGISGNIQRCIELSSADYIYLLSDEDGVNPEIIEKIILLLNQNYNAILSSTYDVSKDEYYIKRNSKYFKKFDLKLISNLHTYISGIILKRDILDISLLKKLSKNIDNIYHHIPALISCLIRGNCYVSSEVLCLKGAQDFRDDHDIFISEKLKKNDKIPFYHPKNRIKQLIFFSEMAKTISIKDSDKQIILNHFSNWAINLLYSNFMLEKYGKPSSNTLNSVKSIDGIGKYFKVRLLKYIFLTRFKTIIKKFIFWEYIKKNFERFN